MLNKYLSLLLLIFVLSFSYSCSDKDEENIKKEEFEILKTEVFSIHDQLMPDLLVSLPAAKDSLNVYIPKVSRTRADSLKKSFARLDSAQINMAKWMKGYDQKKINNIGSIDDKITFIREEKEKLLKVKTLLSEGINNSNNLVMISRIGLYKPKTTNEPIRSLMNNFKH